jgi:hypothetical protein
MTGTLETGRNLDAFLAAHVAQPLARVLGAIAETALPIAHLIRRGGLAGSQSAPLFGKRGLLRR